MSNFNGYRIMTINSFKVKKREEKVKEHINSVRKQDRKNRRKVLVKIK